MSDTYDADALWLKAKLFISHAMDDQEPRTFDERALWATLALELLAKAALSRVSPVLIACPSEEGTNILIASGLIEGDAQFTSLAAHSLIKRCSKAFRPFDEREAKAITRARNEFSARRRTSLHQDSARGLVAPILESSSNSRECTG